MSRSALADHFRRTCRDRSSRPAILNLADDESLSFGDLLEQFNHIREALQRLSLEPGECVVVRARNRAEFAPLLAAVLETGCTLLPIGEVTDSELRSLVDMSGAAVLVTDRGVPRDHAGQVAALGTQLHAARLAGVPTRRYAEATILKLTSGSTDLPKAALAHESHLVNDGLHIIDAMGIAPDDVNLGCIPLSHSYALGNLVMPLVLQGTAIALRPAFSPSQFVADVLRAGVTIFPAVPVIFDHIGKLGINSLPDSLRLLITAGAPIDPASVRDFYNRLGRKIHSFYGSSETGGITYDASDELAETEPLHLGYPLPDTQVELVSGDEAPARVFVRGTAVASRYANDVAPDDSPFRDGGFVTADCGYFDAAGRLVLTGRVPRIVNVAGLKVDPAEVERTLAAVRGVATARVIGVADPRRGEQLVAFVVCADDEVTPVSLRQICAATLSPHKIPRQFIFLERLPVGARGKVDRSALEQLALGREG